MQGSGALEMFLSDASDIIPRILSCAERSLISAWEYSWPSNVSLDNQSHSTIELDIYLEVRPQLFRFSEEKLRTINAELCVFQTFGNHLLAEAGLGQRYFHFPPKLFPSH